jgi:hypothetical protein
MQEETEFSFSSAWRREEEGSMMLSFLLTARKKEESACEEDTERLQRDLLHKSSTNAWGATCSR